MFIIKDWAGNICFNGLDFKTFDEADEYLTLQIEQIYPDTIDNDVLFYIEKGEYFIDRVK